jgi:hypothetical protein
MDCSAALAMLLFFAAKATDQSARTVIMSAMAGSRGVETCPL